MANEHLEAVEIMSKWLLAVVGIILLVAAAVWVFVYYTWVFIGVFTVIVLGCFYKEALDEVRSRNER